MKKLLVSLILILFLGTQNLYAQTSISSNITSNTTWTLANSPYILTNSINVSTGVTLTIEAGVIIKINQGKSIQVDGTLIARGTQQNLISFTSNSMTPVLGDWSNISFTSNSVSASFDSNGNYLSGSILEYCIIEYGGANSSEVLKINGSGTMISPLISKCIIRKNKGIGIYLSYGASKISNCTIESCATGISIQRDNSSPIIEDNLIKDNVSAGIEIGVVINTATIRRNTIKGNSIGINCTVWGNVIIQSNLIIRNNNQGINLSTVTGSLDISKNIFSENLGSAISFNGWNSMNPTINSNQFIGNGINSNHAINQNFGSDVSQARYAGGLFKKNLFFRNSSLGSTVFINGSQATIFDSCNFFSNRASIYLYNSNLSGATINASNNYWNSINDSLIQTRIFDFNDDATKGIVNYTPFLVSPYSKAPISPVSNVKKINSNNAVSLSWTNNPESDISGYKIYYGGFNGYSYTNVIDAGNVTAYTLPAGVNIAEDIAITAYDTSKDGIDDQFDGNESWYSPANLAPITPSNFLANAGAHKVKLTWNLSTSSGVNNYNIYRSTDSINYTNHASAVGNSFTDINLSAYTKYYYKIASFDSLDASYNNYGLESTLSVAISATPTNKIYVDSATGNDVTGIGSSEYPFKKVSAAVTSSVTGDTIYVGKGTYSENLIINKKLTIISQFNQTNTILKPLLPTSQIINFTSGAADSKLTGFTLTNGGNVRGSALDCNFSSPIIENCIITKCGGEAPIRFYYSGAILNNCLIFKNTSGNVFFYDPNDKAPKINHSTIVYNSGIGTGLSNISLIPVFTNCIIYGNTGGSTGGNINILNSIVQGGYLGNETNINSNPRFVDSTNNDYHLLNYSPAIGLGANNTGLAFDFENSTRPLPIGSNPDAGAFESNFGQSSPIIDSTKSLDGYIVFNWTQVPTTNIDSFIVYKDTASFPLVKYVMTNSSTIKFTDSLNTTFNTPLYYRMQSRNKVGLSSGFSNIIKTIVYSSPKLLLPTDKTIKSDTSIRFSWNKVINATRYRIQIASDSSFASIINTAAISDSFYLSTALSFNKYYYWRVRSEDSIKTSKWSKFNTLQTRVEAPKFTRISTSDKKVELFFSIPTTINLRKINIYRDTVSLPINFRDTTAITKLTYVDSVANQIKYNYRVTAVNVEGIESEFSNVMGGVALNSPQQNTPLNNLQKSVLLPTVSWNLVTYATKYHRQIDTSILFNSNLRRNDTLTSISQVLPTPLLANTNYYWRVRSGDNTGWSNWSNVNKFQTIITPPLLVSVTPANKRDTLKWNKVTTGQVLFYKIYRDTIPLPNKLIDSVPGDKLVYVDTNALSLNIKYYYSIKSINSSGVESDMSNIVSGKPFNAMPIPIALVSKTFDNVGEFNTVRLVYSAAGSRDVDGKIVDYKWYVNDSLVNQTDSILIYYFKHGLSNLKLIITDNDGDFNTSTAQIKMSAFVKKFKGGILGGITALDENTLYTADSTYDATSGASVFKIDRVGNTIYPLIVSSKIFTTPSVSFDSSVFITSGSSLNGFNSSGAPLWSTIPLGGLSYVTPTIDSVQNRLYVGVSNKNFFAIDYRTGKVAWNVICDAPINSSAIITGDRKLVFASDNGTLYGFDLRSISGQPTPTWKYTVPGKIIKSPAIDTSNNLYFGTVSGNLVKLKLELNGTVSTLWDISLNSEVKSSPIIDAKGFVYVGTKSGNFYKLNPDNGKIIWTYSSKGAIHSTPTISNYGNIYIADITGYISCLSESGTLIWKYQDSSAISSNLLSINNMVYVGTEGGRLIGFYDNPNTNTVNTLLSYNIQSSQKNNSNGSLAAVSNVANLKYRLNSLMDLLVLPPSQSLDVNTPIWGTFQGNYRRTGSKSAECPEKPALTVSGNTVICNGDSIQLITSAANKFNWSFNNTNLTNSANSPRITVKQPGRYAVVAFGGKGCVVSSDTVLIEAPSSPIKAVINSVLLDTTICFRDSIVLKSSNYYDKYLWSNGDTLQTIIVKNSENISLRGASNASSCFSLPSAKMVLLKNTNAIPNITYTNNTLISTRSSYYKWFFNNNLANGISGSTYLNPTSGFYKVETSLDNYCWDESTDFMVITNSSPIVNDTVSVTLYPNPSAGIFNLVANFQRVTNVITKVTVVDINGKVIYQSQKLIFFSKKIILPINVGTAKGIFGVNMDINGTVKSVIVVVN